TSKSAYASVNALKTTPICASERPRCALPEGAAVEMQTRSRYATAIAARVKPSMTCRARVGRWAGSGDSGARAAAAMARQRTTSADASARFHRHDVVAIHADLAAGAVLEHEEAGVAVELRLVGRLENLPGPQLDPVGRGAAEREQRAERGEREPRPHPPSP